MSARESNRARICFVAHNAFGAISGSVEGFIGGIERQQSLMARWLAARGYETSLLTWDEGQGRSVMLKGVRVLGICARNAGWPGLRFFHPRWTGLVDGLTRAGADLYYQNCAEYVTGQVALWARYKRRRFVYSVASDPDCDPRLPTLSTIRERILYRYGLRHADRVVVQTATQQETLRTGFGVSSTVLPMPCPGPAPADYRPPCPPVGRGGRVLWVGRLALVKRLEWLLEIAAALPDVLFEVAGSEDAEATYIAGLVRRARVQPNVRLLGPIPRETMPEVYSRNQLLCCTSVYEGFPNTFLEAWSLGLPVVSTVDPDRLISTHGLGTTGHDVSSLAAAIRSLLGRPERWREASENARRYYLSNHTVDAVMARFEALFLDVLDRAPGARRERSLTWPTW